MDKRGDIRIVAEPPNRNDIRMDIIFVYGLGYVNDDAWSVDHDIEYLLPGEISIARIWKCGFDVRKSIQDKKNISSQSCALFKDYEIERMDDKRPVIFAAHSLGGLILQCFLESCSPSLLASINGVIFFGTPISGLNEKDWMIFLTSLNRVPKNSSRLSFAETGYSSQLGSIGSKFLDWLPRQTFAKKVVCFYEMPIQKAGIVVQRESAIIANCDATPLTATHIGMIKFSSKFDANYQIVMHTIRSMYCLSDSKISAFLRYSMPPNSHGRLRNLPTTLDGSEEFFTCTQGSSKAREPCQLAMDLEDRGFYEEAKANYQDAFDKFSTHSDTNNVISLFCLDKLASMLRNDCQYQRAETDSRNCVEQRIRISGKGAFSTLLSSGNLALAMRYQSKHQEAYSLIRDALECTDISVLDIIPHVKILSILAKITLDCGYYDVAESISCDVVRISIGLYGDRHPFTLNCMSDTSVIFALQDRMAAAEALSRHALNGLEQALGTDHPHCLKTGRRLADYMRFQKRYSEANSRLKQIFKSQEFRLGINHPDTLSTMSSLGAVCALQGYMIDARRHLNQAYLSQEERLGLKHPHTLWTSHALDGLKALQEKRIEPGEEVLLSLLDILGPKSGPMPKQFQWQLHIASPFCDAIDNEIINLAIKGDEVSLGHLLNKSKMDEKIQTRALREASAAGKGRVVELLLEMGIPVDAKGGFHGTALQAAAFAGESNTVQLLLDWGADVNVMGGIFGNALKAAVVGRHMAVIELLLTRHGDGKIQKGIRDSSLQAAVGLEGKDLEGKEKIISSLLNAKADVNPSDNFFGSPLQQVALYGKEETLNLLLRPEYSADVEKEAGIFGNPLRAAIAANNQYAIKILLKLKANPRSQNSITSAFFLGGYRIGNEETLAKIIVVEGLQSSLQLDIPFRPKPSLDQAHNPAQPTITAQNRPERRRPLEPASVELTQIASTNHSPPQSRIRSFFSISRILRLSKKSRKGGLANLNPHRRKA